MISNCGGFPVLFCSEYLSEHLGTKPAPHVRMFKIYICAKFLVGHNLLAPMDANGAIGAGFSIDSIKPSDVLVAAS